MKKIASLVAMALVFFACAKKAEEAAPVEPVTLPMEITYKGTPAIGSMKNVQTVMEWNKRISTMNTDLGDLLADTVTVHLQDGFEMTAPKDSLVAVVKSFVADLTDMKIVYTTAVPVDNTDTKDEWVFSWTDETYTHKNGTVEHQFIHEDYRLVGGLIREVFQYARKEAPPKPATK
jgi:hypothetical protein